MLESQSAFARRVKRSRQCVNGWIADEKMDGDALVRRGSKVLVDVEKALAQLAIRLDSGQRLGNGLGTKLTRGTSRPIGPGDSSAASDDTAALDRDAVDGAELDALDEGIKREKLLQLQRINRKGAEEEKARRGRYTLTDDVRQQYTRLAAHIIRHYESFIPEIATSVAGRFSVDEREVTIVLNDAFRQVRVAGHERAKLAMESMPRFVDDPDAG